MASALIDRLSGALGGAVDIQVDIFWAVVGGADPAEVIGSLGSRVVSLHLKDGITLPPSAYGDAPFVNVPVGSGTVDPAPSVAAAEATGSVEWLIVEFDHVDGSAVEATRESLDVPGLAWAGPRALALRVDPPGTGRDHRVRQRHPPLPDGHGDVPVGGARCVRGPRSGAGRERSRRRAGSAPRPSTRCSSTRRSRSSWS